MTDGSGNDIEVTADEVEEAVKAMNKNIVLCDYLNNREFTLGVLAKNADESDFIVAGKLYQNNTNLIGIDVREFKKTPVFA